MNAILFPILLVVSAAALLLQLFIPPVDWLHGARVNLFIVLFVYACVVLDFPWLLLFVLIFGFVWDLLQMPFYYVPNLQGEIVVKTGYPFGATILFFLVAGSIAHGVRSLYARGRWEILPLLALLICSGQLFVELIMISVQRQSFAASPDLWWRIVGPGLFALVLMPPTIWVLNNLAALFGISTHRQPEPLFH